ncbi:Tubulin-tyrosine ligase family protein [Tritrichomonas foetus]|uniref:Tubulin-tyrosine ligase family protein n=1 Tax=Tritrichomonas foetus TaxID=1144522 RepID=A0A1J4L656_9EUKA|nr:Tubulin-tyrosine ligase family protein [Tritrichomonas foetus]|eukprot:OHT17429.1 Tubulin-tyrosine ligase family protein [Tritrichomonas foetus]
MKLYESQKVHPFIPLMKGIEVDGSHVKYPAVKEAFQEAEIELTDNINAPIIWWDGDIKTRDFETLGPTQRINKIPGMDYICFKSTTIHAFNQMRRMFPNLYNFFPSSFLLPHQYTDLQRAHNYLQGKAKSPITWIIKPRNGCCGNGIKLIQHIYELAHKSEPAVVQKYIPPYLIDGYKFDFRFYILISTLAPYTVYIYKEGLARFCTQKYQAPNAKNLEDKFAHLTNTSINKENNEAAADDFTRLASDVLDEIAVKEPTRGPLLWKKICDVSMLSLLAIWSSIVASLLNFNSERRLFGRRPMDRNAQVLDTFSKYFHIMGIDIMISEKLQPIVLELNDRPSMIVTYECEAALKKEMVKDAFSHISIDGSPVDGPSSSPNWTKLLPVPAGDKLYQPVNQVIAKTANVFRTYAANRERPHYEERPKSSKFQKIELAPTFVNAEAPSNCQ